ncbi:hypothetical protein OROGR_010887 [Orobanche gracilis]
MTWIPLRLLKFSSLAFHPVHKDDSNPKVEKDFGVNSAIHAVVSYLKETLIAAAFTLCYILGHLDHPIRLYFNPDGDLYSDWEARERFEIWCKEFRKTYSSEKEKRYRFGIFKKTLEWTNTFRDTNTEEEKFYERLRRSTGFTYQVSKEKDGASILCLGNSCVAKYISDEMCRL